MSAERYYGAVSVAQYLKVTQQGADVTKRRGPWRRSMVLLAGCLLSAGGTATVYESWMGPYKFSHQTAIHEAKTSEDPLARKRMTLRVYSVARQCSLALIEISKQGDEAGEQARAALVRLSEVAGRLR